MRIVLLNDNTIEKVQDMPTSQYNFSKMAKHIRATFDNGFRIDDAVCRYLENTLPDPSPAAVAAILKDADDSESHSLIELVFFPDEDMQITLEPLVGSVDVTRQDQRDLIDHLTAIPIDTSIYFPVHGKRIHLTMPEMGVRQFVKRLNLTYHLSLKLTQSIENNLPEAVGLKARVLLRNTSKCFSDRQTNLLAEIFKNLDHTLADYWDCINFMLNVLPEITPQTNAHNFFIKKKQEHFRLVQKAEQFMENLHRSNMETLMLQGERAVNIDSHHSRKAMRWIDQICAALFGHRDYFQSALEEEIEINSSDSRSALSEIITRLS